MSAFSYEQALETVEIELLLEGLYRHYGYDFRDYAQASLRRRIWNFIRAEGLTTVSGLQERLLHNSSEMERFVVSLSVNVSAMFRDPEFYLAFRHRVIPMLRTYPSVQIWQAGCSTGEEIYSLAILLEEAGLYDRCRIYATDLNEVVLSKAKEGIFPLAYMQQYTNNYLKAGGNKSFSEYYTAGYDSVIMRPALKRNIVFAQHNLVTDGPFNEFNVIWCRNVTIYFNKVLQQRVHSLLYNSLIRLGILGLGSKESLQATPHENSYETLEKSTSLYRKIA